MTFGERESPLKTQSPNPYKENSMRFEENYTIFFKLHYLSGGVPKDFGV